MTRTLAIPSILVLAACADERGDPQLLLPTEVAVAWDHAYDGEGDGLGALVPVDVMAYDSATGAALAGVELLLWTNDGVAWPVDAELVFVVDPDACPRCELLWDARRDQFLDLVPVIDTLSLSTDADGLARVYVFVDAFPVDEASGEVESLSVVVSMGDTEQTFLLLPR